MSSEGICRPYDLLDGILSGLLGIGGGPRVESHAGRQTGQRQHVLD